MRIITLFDLPIITPDDRREYTRFRRFLIKNGFVMMQESVYTKIMLNQTGINSVMDSLRKNKPSRGLVQTLIVTEKQFSKIEFLIGEDSSEVINSDARLVIL